MIKNQTYYRMPMNDKLLCLAGAPMQYVAAKDLNFNFAPVASTDKDRPLIINPDQQHAFYNQFLGDSTPIGTSGLYAFGASPEPPAYYAAINLCRNFQQVRFKYKGFPDIKWIDAGSPDWDFLKSNDNHFDLIVIHGVGDTSEGRRYEIVKDFIHRSLFTTVFLVGATKNVLALSWDKIGVEPDGVFQFGRTVHRRV